jgi:hypothetical protein
LPTPPTAEQKQKQRTFHVLLKPANLIRYRQQKFAEQATNQGPVNSSILDCGFHSPG